MKDPSQTAYHIFCGVLHFAFVWEACNKLDLGTLEEGMMRASASKVR
jgi:hypothetical protein